MRGCTCLACFDNTLTHGKSMSCGRDLSRSLGLQGVIWGCCTRHGRGMHVLERCCMICEGVWGCAMRGGATRSVRAAWMTACTPPTCPCTCVARGRGAMQGVRPQPCRERVHASGWAWAWACTALGSPHPMSACWRWGSHEETLVEEGSLRDSGCRDERGDTYGCCPHGPYATAEMPCALEAAERCPKHGPGARLTPFSHPPLLPSPPSPSPPARCHGKPFARAAQRTPAAVKQPCGRPKTDPYTTHPCGH